MPRLPHCGAALVPACEWVQCTPSAARGPQRIGIYSFVYAKTCSYTPRRAQMARSSVTERVATLDPRLRAGRCAVAARGRRLKRRGV